MSENSAFKTVWDKLEMSGFAKSGHLRAGTLVTGMPQIKTFPLSNQNCLENG